MMTKNFKNSFFAIFLLLAATSCLDDDTTDPQVISDSYIKVESHNDTLVYGLTHLTYSNFDIETSTVSSKGGLFEPTELEAYSDTYLMQFSNFASEFSKEIPQTDEITTETKLKDFTNIITTSDQLVPADILDIPVLDTVKYINANQSVYVSWEPNEDADVVRLSMSHYDAEEDVTLVVYSISFYNSTNYSEYEIFRSDYYWFDSFDPFGKVLNIKAEFMKYDDDDTSNINCVSESLQTTFLFDIE